MRLHRVVLLLGIITLPGLLVGCPLTISDCVWSGRAVAWLDENANGIREANEPPLPGVRFHIDDTQNNYTQVEGLQGATSDWKGDARPLVWMPGCPAVQFTIYPEPGPYYQVTTAERLTVNQRNPDEIYEFGFAYKPGAPTATPRPPRPQCVEYHLATAGKNNLSSLVISSAGTVWVGSYDGVYRLDPGQQEWQVYGTGDGLADGRVRRITLAQDGTVWAATQGGAAHFDGQKWTTFTTQDGLIHDRVDQVVEARDGTVWFATWGGVSQYEPGSGQWTSYTESDGLIETMIVSATPVSDGSIWFTGALEGFSRMVPAQIAGQAPTWISYPKLTGNPDGISADFMRLEAEAQDGTYWFSGFTGFHHLDPVNHNVTTYHLPPQLPGQTSLGKVGVLRLQQDGSLWLAPDETDYPLLFHFRPSESESSIRRWRVYGNEDEFPRQSRGYAQSDTIHDIGFAPDGSIWANTAEFVLHCRFVD